MYILTIVFVSQISVVSNFPSRDACELAAQRALAFAVGPQAVASARCDLQVSGGRPQAPIAQT